MRWNIPTSCPCVWDGMLCDIGEHEEPRVGYRQQETMVIGTVTATRAGLPSNGVVHQIGHKRVLERGQPRLECLVGHSVITRKLPACR